MPKSAPKYWNVLKGAYGMYAKNTGGTRPIPFNGLPEASDWSLIRSHPRVKFLQVRYSWRALCPTTSGVYRFDDLIGPLLTAANTEDKYVRIELMYVNPGVNLSNLDSTNPATRLLESPVPAFMFNPGFHKVHANSSGAYAGGCYYMEETHKGIRRKLWPKMWVDEVSTEFANLCEALLLYAKGHTHWRRFMGIQITETLMQKANEIGIGHSDSTKNWTGARLLASWTKITDRIYTTWPEPLHGIYANWGAGPSGVMTIDQWRAWLDKAVLQQGFGYGCPDTWNTSNTCDNLSRITDGSETGSKVATWAYTRYQNKGIIIQSTQNSGTSCLGRSGDRWPVDLLNYARGTAPAPNGKSPRANLFVAARVGARDPAFPNSWEIADYLAAVSSGTGAGNYPLPTAKPSPAGGAAVEVGNAEFDLPATPISAPGVTFHNVDQTGGGGGTGLAAPSNVRIDGTQLRWDHAGGATLAGFRVWVSATSGGSTLEGTVVATPGASVRNIALSSLSPPTGVAYWINVRANATASGTNSGVTSLNVPLPGADLGTPSNVCVSFGTPERITWDYTHATGNPALGFRVLVDGVRIFDCGPDRRWVPRARSTWTSGQTYTVRVVAVGASATAASSRTFTYAGETSGGTCGGSPGAPCWESTTIKDATCNRPRFDADGETVREVFRTKHNAIVTAIGSATESHTVCWLGDSITEQWTRPANSVPWSNFASFSINAGVGSDLIQNVLWRVRGGWVDNSNRKLWGVGDATANGRKYFATWKPNLVVLCIGTNNTGAANRESEANNLAGIVAIVAEIKEQSTNTKFLVIPPLPRGASGANAQNIELRNLLTGTVSWPSGASVRVRDVSASFTNASGALLGGLFVETEASAKLHLNASGYTAFWNAIKADVNELRA